MNQDERIDGIDRGIVVWGAVLTGFLGLLGLVVAVFGDKTKRGPRLIGSSIAIGIWVALFVILGIVGALTQSTNGTANAKESTASIQPDPTLSMQQLAFVESVSTASAQTSATVSAADSATADASLAAAEATEAAEPTATPSPPPHDLALLSQMCTYDDVGFTTCQGSVRNDSGESISDVVPWSRK